MSLTKKQEEYLNNQINNTLKEVQFQGLRAGATGILGAVLEICNKDKSAENIVEEIKVFCENSLNMEGIK